MPGLRYATKFEAVEGEDASSFNNISLRRNMVTSLPWKKITDASKQSQYVTVNPTTKDCSSPKSLKQETYMFEAQDTFWKQKHMFYFFPVMCKEEKSGQWVLKHMYVLDSEKGGKEFQGFKDINIFLFSRSKKEEDSGKDKEDEDGIEKKPATIDAEKTQHRKKKPGDKRRK